MIAKIDFFANNHIKETSSNSEFGICDGNNEQEQPAYLSFDEDRKAEWAATVNNHRNVKILFLPVDNNIPMFRSDGTKEKRCDGMIFIEEEAQKSICFIELKERTDRNKTWRNDGINQLISTITIFSLNHNILEYNQRRAFVCNRKRPYYAYSNREELENFQKKYHVLLYVQPIIDID